MISLKTYIPYYKENLRLAMPVILSQVGQITVQLADTAMVGWYGGDDPTPLAAVSFGTSIFYIIFISAMGLAFGLTPLVGEHFARGDQRHAAHLLQNGLVLFTLAGIATGRDDRLRRRCIRLRSHRGGPTILRYTHLGYDPRNHLLYLQAVPRGHRQHPHCNGGDHIVQPDKHIPMPSAPVSPPSWPDAACVS